MASVVDAARQGDQFAVMIVEAVNGRIAELIEEETKAVAERVNRRVREEVGLIAGRVLQHYDIGRAQNIITIRVQTGPDANKEPI